MYYYYRREANGGTNFIRVCLCICLFVSALERLNGSISVYQTFSESSSK